MPKKPPAPGNRLQQLRYFKQRVSDRLHQHHRHAKKLLDKHSLSVDQLREQGQQFLAAASVAGAVLSHPSVSAQALARFGQEQPAEQRLAAEVSAEEYLSIIDKLRGFALMPVGHLPEEQEGYVEQQLSELLGFQVSAELEGHRLNHSVGIMGGEQHLMRYPGDDLSQHDAYQSAGIAPGRGAWGWFTEGGELNQKAIEREKYYFAVQTLYLPDWNSNYQELKPWYKYRKMIAINPAEELAAVGVVADAGPAAWVQKQYGGSPEIIREAKIWSPAAKGRVILLFVDDPEDTVPLGIINLRESAQLAGVMTELGQQSGGVL